MTAAAHQPAFVLHDHRKPRPHFDLRLEQDGVLRSWALPRGLPVSSRQDRLAIAVPDHDLDHLTYTDEHKSIADIGWWEEHDRTERRFVFSLHGVSGSRRFALINTGGGWLLHLTKDQTAAEGTPDQPPRNTATPPAGAAAAPPGTAAASRRPPGSP